MNPTSLCASSIPNRSRSAKAQRVHERVFAPQAEDHFPRVSDATGVLLSRPRATASPPSDPVLFLRPETSYYSGITDACITFVAASRLVQLTLNASPSRPIRERWSRQFVRVMACHWLNEEMAQPVQEENDIKNKKTKKQCESA
jgi:hypothetical protein